jgi:hypothetical protein
MNPNTLEVVWQRIWDGLKFEKGKPRKFEVTVDHVYELTCKQFLGLLPSVMLSEFDRRRIAALKSDPEEYAKFDALYEKNLNTTFDFSIMDELEAEIKSLEKELSKKKLKSQTQASRGESSRRFEVITNNKEVEQEQSDASEEFIRQHEDPTES